MEDARVATRRRPRARSSSSRASSAPQLREERGGALWATREARPEPLEAAFAALLDRDDATVLVGTIDEHVVGLRRRARSSPSATARGSA